MKEKIKLVTVAELYQEATSKAEPLLSRYTAPFWAPYLAQNAMYDRTFLNMYRTFKYTYTGETETDTLTEFTESVKAVLLLNNKKYVELLRMENIDDELYNILDNYDVTETLTRDTTNDSTENVGERKDSTEYGAQSSDTMQSMPTITTTRENTVSAFDSDEYSPREKAIETTDSYAIDTQRTDESHTDNMTSGAQENKTAGKGHEEYELKRKGNIGVMTQSDVLLKHLELWTPWSYYKMIWQDIADVLLYV